MFNLENVTKWRYQLAVVAAVRTWLKNTAMPPKATYITFDGLNLFLKASGEISLSPLPKLDFIVCQPGKLTVSLAASGQDPDITAWQCLLVTDEVAVYEKHQARNTGGLRLGFSTSEKNALSLFVRGHIIAKLGGGSSNERNEVPPEERLTTIPATIDVAFWVKGELRGSQIVTAENVYQAAALAAERSLTDSRFKPLALEEMEHLRLEITYMDDLFLPLPTSSYRQTPTLSYPNLGYRLETPSGSGWFVPAVFNILPLTSLNEVKNRLASKINYHGKDKDLKLSVFIVHTWIENYNNATTVLEVRGPLVTHDEKIPAKMTAEAVQHICYNQERDGNLPPRLDPEKTSHAQLDTTRLAFALYALSLYENETKNEVVRRTLEAAYNYWRRFGWSYLESTPNQKALTLAYTLRAMSYLKYQSDYEKAKKELFALLPHLSYEPILFSQISFTWLNYDNAEAERTAAYSMVAQVEADFRRKIAGQEKLSLAQFPELMTLLPLVPTSFKSDAWLSSKQVEEWYLEQQLPDGSFPDTPHSRFSYVRGTAKILECLPPTEQNAREKTWQWLRDMQYTRENLYHVTEINQNRLLGGFRHDVFERSAWLDAAAHVLVAAAQEKNR